MKDTAMMDAARDAAVVGRHQVLLLRSPTTNKDMNTITAKAVVGPSAKDDDDKLTNMKETEIGLAVSFFAPFRGFPTPSSLRSHTHFATHRSAHISRARGGAYHYPTLSLCTALAHTLAHSATVHTYIRLALFLSFIRLHFFTHLTHLSLCLSSLEKISLLIVALFFV
jgi:hypothetical protein